MRKRARTASNAGATDAPDIKGHVAQGAGDVKPLVEGERKHDPEFWYSDGNIILVARDVEFRVYKGLLADHSSVFRDMFSLPQPPTKASSPSAFENGTCPVVHLYDSPEDLRHVLRAYMPKGDSSPFFMTSLSYSYPAISAAIRLGHKYQMQKLLDHAIAYLKRHYTNDYDAWASHPDYVPAGFGIQEHAIGVVNLARLAGEASILPTALLACCILNDDILDGFVREDGAREQLALEDVKLCLAAKDRLVREMITVAVRVLQPVSADGCKSRQFCTDTFKRELANMEARVEDMVNPDPCGVPLDVKFGEGILCMACRMMVQKRDDRERRAVWKKLPEIFGVTLVHAPANAAGGNAGVP
ncbi:uncharacterized protein TRAVEDRAFT_128165 [Trametes versicolor FP-101664 SS1]|uniref:uncharacterized protein n=1 Tax=Trametes versicolor (strain FP-101664) TaxID=717944 RepID=UPI0004622C6A|nr:uncharacterized protein TRAVEDRAFT_128165 [Trametes versicolor FP-101664 SS1]EIW56923.1 hypothetical protein TRAVEDRAFT_128165 [Trametes versicolor FP-101664 SS1]